MGTTGIRGFINQSLWTADIKDHEDPLKPGHFVQIKLREGKPCDMWVPWCNNSTDFLAAHYITVQFNSAPVRKLWIWQRDNNVVFTQAEAFTTSATPVGGMPQEGGNRVVLLSSSGNLEFYPVW